jgi:hypothetical protein
MGIFYLCLFVKRSKTIQTDVKRVLALNSADHHPLIKVLLNERVNDE